MIIISLATPRFRHERGEDGVDGAAAAGGTEEDEEEHDDELGDPAAAFVAELVGEDAELGFDGFAFGVECDALLFQLGKDASQTVFLPHPLDENQSGWKRKERKGRAHLLLPSPTIFIFPLTLPFVPPDFYALEHRSHDFGLFFHITCYEGRVAF